MPMPSMDHFHSIQFAARAEELMQQHHVPGLALAIIQNNETASLGFGYAALDAQKPCTPDTIFDIASSSKSLTAASVALLVEDDENHPDIHWDTPMSKLLPEDFVMSQQSYTDEVTVEDILSHRTGLPSHDNSYLGLEAERPDNPRSVTRRLRGLPVIAPIRSRYMYCNLMYTVATYLVEVKANLSFSEYLRRNIFEPLGMDSTSLQPDEARSRGLADRITEGYAWNKETEKYLPIAIMQSPEDQGAGSILTSVKDYAKYVKAMINHEAPFTPELCKGLIRTRSMPEPDADNCPPLTSSTLYAAGWEVSWYRGHKIVQHDGLITGFSSTHFFLPDLKFGGVLLANSEGGLAVIPTLVHELLDQLLQTPKAEIPDWNTFYTKQAAAESEDESVEELIEMLCPGLQKPEEQTVPLSAYTGTYWNAGYDNMVVQIKDDQLFLDCTDRSNGFTLTLEHICDQTKYIAHLSDAQEGGDIPFRSGFELREGKAVRLGLHIEAAMKEYVWFDRVA